MGCLGRGCTCRHWWRASSRYTVESGTALGVWVPAVLVGSPEFNGNGTETLIYRHPDPKAGAAKQFLRLRVTRLP